MRAFRYTTILALLAVLVTLPSVAQGKDHTVVHRQPLEGSLQLVTVGDATVGVRSPWLVCEREVVVRRPLRLLLGLRVAVPHEEPVGPALVLRGVTQSADLAPDVE